MIGCAGLKCYKCEGDRGIGSCAAFSRARSAYVVRHLLPLFEAECLLGQEIAGVQQFCYKIAYNDSSSPFSNHNHDQQLYSCRPHDDVFDSFPGIEKRARGCTPFGKEIAKMGCNGEICLCDHDLCNNANSYDHSRAILLLALYCTLSQYLQQVTSNPNWICFSNCFRLLVLKLRLIYAMYWNEYNKFTKVVQRDKKNWHSCNWWNFSFSTLSFKRR